MRDIFRKLEKAFRSLQNPLFRRALRIGVSPSHEHRTMLEILGPVCTVVDVGANCGQFALMALNSLPNAQIHSFEPLSEAVAKFERVTLGQDRVKLHRVALGATEMSLPIHVSARADSSSLLSLGMQSEVYPGTHEVRVETVQVAPLDSILSLADIKSPALLKIDVQGYEMQVLQGCKSLLQQFDWIFVELSFVELYIGQVLCPEVVSWLATHGFALNGVYVTDMSYKNGKTIQGDFLFKRIAAHGAT